MPKSSVRLKLTDKDHIVTDDDLFNIRNHHICMDNLSKEIHLTSEEVAKFDIVYHKDIMIQNM